MAAIVNENQIFSSQKLSEPKKSKTFFDARVSACARSTFYTVIGIQLCLVKLHRARLSTLRQFSSCLRAMLRRVGKYRIPSVKIHRIVHVYMGSVKFVHDLVQ